MLCFTERSFEIEDGRFCGYQVVETRVSNPYSPVHDCKVITDIVSFVLLVYYVCCFST